MNYNIVWVNFQYILPADVRGSLKIRKYWKITQAKIKQNTKTLFLLRIKFTTALTFLTLKFSKKLYFLDTPLLYVLFEWLLSPIGTYFSNASRPKLNHEGTYLYNLRNEFTVCFSQDGPLCELHSDAFWIFFLQLIMTNIPFLLFAYKIWTW